MKRWFYNNVSLIWLVALCVIMCLIYCVLFGTVGRENADAVANLLIVLELVLAPSGMVAFGIWGERKIKEMDKEV